jgi:hypothetical protein
MMGIASASEAVFRESKEATGLQHTPHLAEKLRSVGDVHRDVLAVGAVEEAVRVGEVVCIALLERNLVPQIEQGRELVRRLDEWCGDVDPSDRAAEALREVARRPAEAAADVEDVVACLARSSTVNESRGFADASSAETIKA